MAASKSVLEGAAVPSLIALLLCIASTATAYGTALGLNAEKYFGLGTGIAAVFLAVWLIARNVRPASARRGRGLARAWLICLLVPAAIAAIPAVRALRCVSPPSAAAGAGPVTATVKEARMLRYSLETELEAPGPAGAGWLRIMAYLPPDADAQPGDTILFRKSPRALAGGTQPSRYARGLLRRGFSHSAYLSADDYTVISRAAPSERRRFRTFVAERIERVFAADTASLLKGLYFGNKNHIGKETVHRFTRAGVLHILAASGSHLATLAFLPLAFLGLLRVDRRAIFIIVVLVLAAYLYLTDLPVSLQRAFMMFAIGGLHLLLDYERNTLNALFHSAGAIIIMEPWEIYSLGFQLTFGATLGILILYRTYSEALRKLPALLRGPLALTLSAQALVFPVLALQLGEINIISLASNLVIVPLVQFVFAASAALLALDAAAPGLAQAPAALVDLCFTAGGQAAAFFASLPGHFSPGAVPPILLLSYLLYLAPIIKINRFRTPALICIPAACLLTWHVLSGPRMNENTVAVLKTNSSKAAFMVVDGVAHITGSVGSPGDARALSRAVASSGAGTASLRLSSLHYRNIDAATHLAKSLCLSSFVVEGDFIYGKYLGRLLTVLDRDGTSFGTDTADNTRNKGDDSLRGKNTLARERAALLIKEALEGNRCGTAGKAAPRRRIVQIETIRGPGDA